MFTASAYSDVILGFYIGAIKINIFKLEVEGTNII